MGLAVPSGKGVLASARENTQSKLLLKREGFFYTFATKQIKGQGWKKTFVRFINDAIVHLSL